MTQVLLKTMFAIIFTGSLLAAQNTNNEEVKSFKGDLKFKKIHHDSEQKVFLLESLREMYRLKIPSHLIGVARLLKNKTVFVRGVLKKEDDDRRSRFPLIKVKNISTFE